MILRTRRILFLGILFLISTPVMGFAADELIRVLVAENKSSLTLSVKGDYVVKSIPGGEVLGKGTNLRKMIVKPHHKGIAFGSKIFPVKAVRIVPAVDRDVFLDKWRFRGTIDILSKVDKLSAVNQLPMEHYLYGVLHHEVASWWPMEALKAQAIAARTYAYYQKSVSKSQEFDVKNTTSSQVYGGSANERYRTKNAVNVTRGQVLVFEDKVFPAYFHATCGGRTAAASELWNIDIAPLKGGVVCPYCKISPHFYWEAHVPLAKLEEILRKNNKAVGQILRVEPVTQTPSGRIGRLRITGTTGEFVIAAKDFRIWIGGNKIKSTDFQSFVREDAAVFRGKGWGHGVGLCQWGSLGQSLVGHSHEKILQLYFPSAEIREFLT